jgi:hypothetical protein
MAVPVGAYFEKKNYCQWSTFMPSMSAQHLRPFYLLLFIGHNCRFCFLLCLEAAKSTGTWGHNATSARNVTLKFCMPTPTLAYKKETLIRSLLALPTSSLLIPHLRLQVHHPTSIAFPPSLIALV